MQILAIIPARSGSKGLAHKNIIKVAGKPMLAHSIECALASKLITRIIVSTDSEEYMEIAKQYGAQTPFKRPAKYAKDDSLDLDVFHHALTWLQENEGYAPDICVQLRPCSPSRDPATVDKIIQRLIDNPDWDSIRTVSRSLETPYKTWLRNDDGTLAPIEKGIPECYNLPRQDLPPTYYQNGYLDAFRPSIVLDSHSMTGKTIGSFLIDEYYHVDHRKDLDLVKACVDIRAGKKTFLIDAEYAGHEIVYKLKKAGHTVEVMSEDSDEARAHYSISPRNIALMDLIKILGM